MADLSQAEADALLSMQKRRVSEQIYPFTSLRRIEIPLQSMDGREQFLLDRSRGRINLLKGTYQTRAQQTVILARIDFGGSPHRNPDGSEVPCPHLHRYREGFADKWESRCRPFSGPMQTNGACSSDFWNTAM